MVPVQTGSGTVSGNMGSPRLETKQSKVLGKSQTGTGTMGFGPVQTGSQLVQDRTSPTLTLKRLLMVPIMKLAWLKPVTHAKALLGCH